MRIPAASTASSQRELAAIDRPPVDQVAADRVRRGFKWSFPTFAFGRKAV